MTIKTYLVKHPEIGMWAVGLVITLLIATLGLGYLVLYRIPDMDARHKELVSSITEAKSSINESKVTLQNNFSKLEGSQSSERERVAKWRDDFNARLKTVHLIACEAARRRSDECARAMVMQSVKLVAPIVSKNVTRVSLKVSDESRPIVSSKEVGEALGFASLEAPTVQQIVADQNSHVEAVSLLLAADGTRFYSAASGQIRVSFTNGEAILATSADSRDLAMMRTSLNQTASLIRKYHLLSGQVTASGSVANVKAEATFDDMQRLSSAIRHNAHIP
jgi:hypothetical protein